MLKKPSYEELEQRIQELEQKVIQLKQADEQNQVESSILFNKAPLVMVVLDHEHRVCKLNEAAVNMTRRLKESSIGLHGGEALRCINAMDDPQGCGYSAACEFCVVRKTVLDTFESGQDHRSVEAPISYATENGTVDIWVLVSTCLLELPEGDGSLFVWKTSPSVSGQK